MKTKSTSLIRPKRQSLFAGLMIVAWLTLGLWMLAATRESAHATIVNDQPEVHRISQFGWPVYLTIHATADDWQAPATVRYDLNPLNLVVIAISLMIWAAICCFGYAWLVDRYRVPAHQCDECGYNLTGVAHDKCPECGAPRTGGAT